MADLEQDCQGRKEIRDCLVHLARLDQKALRDNLDRMDGMVKKADVACLEKMALRGEMVLKENQVCLVLMAYRAKMAKMVFRGHLGLKENQDSPEFLVEDYPDQKDVMGDQVLSVEMDKRGTKEKRAHGGYREIISMASLDYPVLRDLKEPKEEPDWTVYPE